MIIQSDTKHIDFWWDKPAIQNMLSKVDWDLHNLSPSLLKFQLMNNQWIFFKGNECLYAGYFTFKGCKQFWITMVVGKNLKEEIYEFLDYLRQYYNCNSFAGYNVPALGKLYSRWLSKIGTVSTLNYYELDLTQLDYEFGDNKVYMPKLSEIDNWYQELYSALEDICKYDPSLSRDVVLRNVVDGHLIAFKIGNNWIVGVISFNLVKKIFYTTYIQSTITQTELAEFLFFLEIEMCCRYFSYFDCDTDRLDFGHADLAVRKQITTFTRSNDANEK